MFFVTLVVFILVLGVLVFIHELGHYLAAKFVGIKVEEFAIGMGPKIWGFKRGEEEFNIRALPIGGFVKMYGEGDYDIVAPGSFAEKSPAARLLVLVAGVTMNILLAFVIFFVQGVMTGFAYPSLERTLAPDYKPWFGELSQDYIVISDEGVSDTSPLKGKINGLEVVTKVNNKSYEVDNFKKLIEDNKGKELTFELRGFYENSYREVKVVPREKHPDTEGPLGIILFSVSYSQYSGFGGILFSGVGQTLNTIQSFGFGINMLIDRAEQEQSLAPVAEGVTGAVGIFTLLDRLIIGFGIVGILSLMALFSVNLAIINMLPIPALDGGHVLFTLSEMLLRKKLPTRVYNYFTIAGFVFLMSLMLFVTFSDVIRHTSVGNVFCNEDRKVLGFICDLSGTRQSQ